MPEEIITAPNISIHTLRMEGDMICIRFASLLHISIHTLRMEGDLCGSVAHDLFDRISIHTLRMEGDHNRS